MVSVLDTYPFPLDETVFDQAREIPRNIPGMYSLRIEFSLGSLRILNAVIGNRDLSARVCGSV